ncbi:MAG: twin-arginine translocase TatA/TatE family subunit [Alphaproteobacteria bacterium]|nr:twin-arginine translocase TatA/TatE family subunit [Alphaproteobacteria bacterium]MBP9877890.1 twin-arginine translocase TatA/TatE family subunit [Alphaproteobacteria bacterium]
MFSVGWSELFLIFIVALFLLGPKELPVALRYCMKVFRYFSKLFSGLKGDIQKFVDEADPEKPVSFKELVVSDIKREELGDFAQYYDWDENGKMIVKSDDLAAVAKPKVKKAKRINQEISHDG